MHNCVLFIIIYYLFIFSSLILLCPTSGYLVRVLFYLISRARAQLATGNWHKTKYESSVIISCIISSYKISCGPTTATTPNWHSWTARRVDGEPERAQTNFNGNSFWQNPIYKYIWKRVCAMTVLISDIYIDTNLLVL